MADVTVKNQITGAVGKVPERLYNSPAFNKNDVWVLYDGSLEPDCGCNGQTTTETLETEIPLSEFPEIEYDMLDNPELSEREEA